MNNTTPRYGGVGCGIPTGDREGRRWRGRCWGYRLRFAVYEALGEAAFHERRKIHDLIMEGIDAILKKRQVWGGAVGAVGDLISGVVGKSPWAPAPLTGVMEYGSPRRLVY